MIKIKKIHFFLPFFLVSAISGLTQPVSLPKCSHQFVVIAHRGDHTQAPENTLTAFQNAIDAGADFVEIDLRTTKDSQLVIMHDATIDRMTEYNGRVKDFMLDSLRRIKVMEPLHPEWGLHVIPTFKEVLKLCKGKINIYLDFKDATVTTAYREILNAEMEKNIVVYINVPHQFTEWRKIAPQMPLMISLPKVITAKEEMFELLDSVKIDVLDGSYDDYTAETLLAAKEKHIPIWADIQSEDEGPDRWNRALRYKFEGLQTDHPGALIKYLKKKRVR
jgi:glycerophosphoryl diester phosphodiesterase